MTGHTVLIAIAILCELAAAFGIFWPVERPYGNSLIAAGLLFYFIASLVP
jgi:hypothetical protein